MNIVPRRSLAGLLGCLALASCAPPSVSAPVDPCEVGAWCLVRGGPRLTIDGDREHGTVFAFGPEGAFLRWDVDRWVRSDVPTTTTLTSAAVLDADDAWACDGATAWHFDGSRWTEALAEVPLARVLSASDGSVWAVGVGTLDGHGGIRAPLYVRDGDRWALAAEPYPYCISQDAYVVLPGADIWSAGYVCDAAGAARTVEVRRYDGASWERVGDAFAFASLGGLFVREGRVRVSAGGVFEWDGARWSPIATPDYPQGLPPSQIAWGDGLGYTTMPSSLGCESAYRLDDTHVWCFGSGQIYFDADGRSWSPTLDDPFAQTAPASAWGTMPPALWAGSDSAMAWGSGATDVYRVRASTGSMLEHFDGTAWSTVVTDRVFSLDGSGPDDVWFATEGGVLHFDGRDFVPLAVPEALVVGGLSLVDRVRSLGPGVVLASTGAQLFLYDGTWTVRYEAPPSWWIRSIAGDGPSDLYLTQTFITRGPSASAVLHFDGGAWSQLSDLDGVVTTSAGETWLAAGTRTQRLGATEPAPPSALALDTFSETSLWVGPDALWLSAPGVTQRYARQ